MATLTAYRALIMPGINFQFFYSMAPWDYTSTRRKFAIDLGFGDAQVYEGLFEYRGTSPTPVGGRLYGFHVTNTSKVHFEVTGLDFNFKTVLKAANTYQRSDDWRVVKRFFKGDDEFHGSDGTDTLIGFAGNDVMYGNGGYDILLGEAGNDILVGGAGSDELYGGKGADTFRYLDVVDSYWYLPDVIVDFKSKQGDRIDLSAIDADENAAGDQAFRFIGSSSFSGEAGELRYEHVDGDTRIHADVNGDGKPDMTIIASGVLDLTERDFIL